MEKYVVRVLSPVVSQQTMRTSPTSFGDAKCDPTAPDSSVKTAKQRLSSKREREMWSFGLYQFSSDIPVDASL